jgi:hypothetical protein
MSAIGGNPENICSVRALPVLTPKRTSMEIELITEWRHLHRMMIGHFVNIGFFGVVGGAAAAGERTKVTHAFQPFGRSDESNSS